MHTGNGGLVIEVSDIGIGMTESDLRVANTRLQSGGEVNPYTARHMGLFVVGRLAAQHGLVVRLRSTIAGEPNSGTTASVFVPSELLVVAGAPDQFGGAEYGSPADAHAGIHTALALDEDHDYADHLDEPGQESSQRPLRGARRVVAAAQSRRQRNLRHPGVVGPSRGGTAEGGVGRRGVVAGGLDAGADRRACALGAPGRAGARRRPCPRRHVGVLRVPRTGCQQRRSHPAGGRRAAVAGAPAARAAGCGRATAARACPAAVDGPSPTAGADDAIYQKMLSEWLVDPTDLAKSEDLNWESVWDHGWSAAAAAEDAPVLEHTEEGLPVREPGARLVPGAVDSAGLDGPPPGLGTSTAVLTGATAATTR